jgi:cation transport ATPase
VTTTPAERVQLDISGMTCASCAARVEKQLNGLDGVDASVNFATEKATVTFDAAAHDTGDLVAAVEAIGYGAAVPMPTGAHGQHDHGEHEHGDAGDLKRRLIVSLVLGVPVLVLSMVPAWQFRYWQWVALAWPRRWSCGAAGPSIASRCESAAQATDGHPRQRGCGRRLWLVGVGARSATPAWRA